MSKQTSGFSPLLNPAVARGLASVAALLSRKLLAHQTLTLLFTSQEAGEDPNKAPALVVTRLPGDDWVIELPLPAILPAVGLGSRAKFFIFNNWMGPGEEIGGTFSWGPKKLLHEPDLRSLTNSVISAVEDLLLVSDRMDVSRILIADKSGEVSDGLGRSITNLLAANSESLALLPANSNFFQESALGTAASEVEEQHQAAKLTELETMLGEKNMSFFATTCYKGLPRNLFVLDYSTDELKVSSWTGKEFVTCMEPHTLRSIRGGGMNPQPGGPREIPSIYVSSLWPKALKRLGLPFLGSGGELQ